MNSKNTTVLVVDDEPSICYLLHKDLVEMGYICNTVSNGEEALNRLSTDSYDILLLDLKLPGISGMDILRKVKADRSETAVIVITGAGDIQTAVDAMKNGAVDFITKPFELENLNSSIENVLKSRIIRNSAAEPDEDVIDFEELDSRMIRCLDHIADGVADRMDSLIDYATTLDIIETTADIARNLNIPGRQIDKWLNKRQEETGIMNIQGRQVGKRGEAACRSL